MNSSFVGGALSFKGGGDKSLGKKSKKKKKSDAKYKSTKRENAAAVAAIRADVTSAAASGGSNVDDDDMTEAERKALKLKLEREKAELTKIALKSHRERVEEFNEKLSSQTEHNDIPRVRIFVVAFSLAVTFRSFVSSIFTLHPSVLLVVLMYILFLVLYLNVHFFPFCIRFIAIIVLFYFNSSLLQSQVSAAGNG